MINDFTFIILLIIMLYILSVWIDMAWHNILANKNNNKNKIENYPYAPYTSSYGYGPYSFYNPYQIFWNAPTISPYYPYYTYYDSYLRGYPYYFRYY